ncbi:MAG: TolC family protein [Planctomycetia bacterium]|jgi:outer membrane protein TolC
MSGAAPMPALRGAILAAGLLAVSCLSAREEARDARARVGEEAARRLGWPPAAPPPDAPCRVQELLHNGLDEDDAARMALGLHRGVLAQLARLDEGAAEAVSAALWASPVLDASLVKLDDGTEIDLGLAQPVWQLVSARLRRAKSQAELRALEHEVVRVVVDATFHARRAHAEASLARAEFERSEAQLAAARAAEQLMQDLVAAGNATPAEAARQAAATARRAAARLDAQHAWLEAREALNRATGLWGEAIDWELAPTKIEEVADDFEGVEAKAVAASLDLAAARARIDALAQAAGMADIESWAPDAAAGIVAKRDAGGDSLGLGPRLELGLPLADGGSSARTAAEARLARAEHELWTLAVEVRSAARTFRDRVRSLRAAEAQARNELVPAERRLVEETLRNFNAMQVGAFDVLRARSREIEAERRAARLRYELRLARLDLAELAAGSLSRARLAPDAPDHGRFDAGDGDAGH